jgi:hypothetical protein
MKISSAMVACWVYTVICLEQYKTTTLKARVLSLHPTVPTVLSHISWHRC